MDRFIFLSSVGYDNWFTDIRQSDIFEKKNVMSYMDRIFPGNVLYGF